MKKIFLFIGFVAVASFFSCSQDEPEDVRIQMEDVRSRGTSLNDSTENDSGKVRIGDVVLDTTWNGETHIYF